MNRRFSHTPLRRGFTLVELLVVVAIIALLISILLPALGRARQASAKVACASNMRQIALAEANYAAAFKGFLPPPPGAAADGGNFTVSNCFNKDNIKTLVDSKMLVNDKVRYCPTGPTGELFGGRANYEINPHPGLLRTTAGLAAFGSVDPAVGESTASWPGSAGAPFLAVRWKKLQQIPKDRALLIDVIYGATEISHFDSKTKSGSWNVCFPDGHVVLAPSKAVSDALPGRVAANWEQLNDYVRCLELIATNRDPKMGNATYPWGAHKYQPVVFVDTPAAPAQ